MQKARCPCIGPFAFEQGLLIADGILAGLCARAAKTIGPDGKVT
jgi:hypothetical protein